MASSVGERVFAIYELAEMILLNVKPQQLFAVQRVNRSCHNVVQQSCGLRQKMYLKSSEDVKDKDQVDNIFAGVVGCAVYRRDDLKPNPIFSPRVERPDFSKEPFKSSKLPPISITMNAHLSLAWDQNLEPLTQSALRYQIGVVHCGRFDHTPRGRQASWRKMQICDPPIKEITMNGMYIRNCDGLTFGNVMDSYWAFWKSKVNATADYAVDTTKITVSSTHSSTTSMTQDG